MSTTSTLQEQFLNVLRTQRSQVTLFLVNGYQLRGFITGYDNYAIVFFSEGKQNLIYKHAISTIVPAVPIQITTESL